MNYQMVVGLEVHVELSTKSKIFCSCTTEFGGEPNTHVCPVCSGMPGVLPVLNKKVVDFAIRAGLATNCEITRYNKFDRKNYFYPDLPKAYQISQWSVPIVENGELIINIENDEKRICITRAHLEEDAGKNTHEAGHSLVDLNRSGTPLLEIVSEPDMRNSDEAVAYLKKLHSILRFLNISDANMQEGSFRCDVNVSIRPKGENKLYTRVEIKNLNSFRFIQKAIEYEASRQIAAWEDGNYEREVVQETRLFDTTKLITKPMRSKEEAAEYRYFPDPDLLPIVVPDDLMNEASKLPELPDEKKTRYINELGLKPYDAGVIISTYEMARYFEDLINAKISPKLCVTWLCVELLGRLKNGVTIENSPVNSTKMIELLGRIEDGTISANAAKKVLDELITNQSASVDEIIEKLGLKQVSDDGAIDAIAEAVLAANADKVAEFKAGKDKLFGFFVGQVMKEGKGAFNPTKVNEILKVKLG